MKGSPPSVCPSDCLSVWA